MPERRGMLIKNVSEAPLKIRMVHRVLLMDAGDERLVSAVEVRDKTLREHLQMRTIAVVRPSTDEEAEALAEQFGDAC